MSLELPFITLDVFTTTRYKGNPLAVVTIPSSVPTPPTQEQKQLIAREFNLSETVFVHESEGSSRKIDIFIVDAELPFAGHPTVGTAVSLLKYGVSELVTKAGPIAIEKEGDSFVKAGIPHNVHLHRSTLSSAAEKSEPGYLSYVDAIRQAELEAPIFSIVKGMAFVFVKLPDLETLGQVNCSTGVFSPKLLDESWQDGIVGRLYYVDQESDDESVVKVRTRMILHSFEDPATGSASCALAAYLTLHGGRKDGKTRFELTQGVEMGRQSDIVVDITKRDGALDTVSLAGTAVQVMKGSVTI
jgi:PhzF family phenazine biosynthesis protein